MLMKFPILSVFHLEYKEPEKKIQMNSAPCESNLMYMYEIRVY